MRRWIDGISGSLQVRESGFGDRVVGAHEITGERCRARTYVKFTTSRPTATRREYDDIAWSLGSLNRKETRSRGSGETE